MLKLPRIRYFIVAIVLLAGEVSYAQNITMRLRNASIRKVIKYIMFQTNLAIVVTSAIRNDIETYSINVKNMPVTQVLDLLFHDKPYGYTLSNGMIIIRPNVVKGRIVDVKGEPLQGVTISVDNKPIDYTNNSGRFELSDIDYGDTLSFSYVKFKIAEVIYDGKLPIVVKAPSLTNDLDNIYVVSNGNERVTINNIPNSYFRRANMMQSDHVLASLEGRIPGLLISQQSGLPGTAYSMQIRGQSTIGIRPGLLAPNEPILIVDGIPYAASINSLQTGSPINALKAHRRNTYENINPDDIESITVLKDPEATAIYGCKGANGVIVINTKRGIVGRPVWEVSARAGIGVISRLPRMLNAKEYFELRREAFRNDKIIPTPTMAPDLIEWDTNAVTNFRQMMINTNSRKNNLQTSVSGGSPVIQYYFSGAINHEITSSRDVVFYKNSFHSHITYKSKNKKLSSEILNFCGFSGNSSVIGDRTAYMYLPPNIPSFTDSAGSILWSERTAAFNNPLSYFRQIYSSNSSSNISKWKLSYQLLSSARVIFNVGHHGMNIHETVTLPARLPSVFAPDSTVGTTYVGDESYKSFICEPQVEYTCIINSLKFSCLAGATFQRFDNHVVNTISPSLFVDSTTTYKSNNIYSRGFSRFCFEFAGKYLMNVTLRRESSSRLRAGGRTGNFGAMSLGWVFTNDTFFRRSFPIISYGKLKAAYGVTGDDQIAVNNYSNSLPGASVARPVMATIFSSRLTREDYSWQVSSKLEMGMELGLFENRFFLYLDLYRYRIGDQVIGIPDPSTGLNTLVARNSSAIVQNKGVEMSVHLKNKRLGKVKWYGNLAITLPKNELLTFPGLPNSSYNNSLVTGKSLTVQQGYHYKGVNPITGLFEVADLNKDGDLNRQQDYTIIGDLDPKFYGSLQLGFNYCNWALSLFVEGRMQNGYSLLYQIYANVVPGRDMVNLPVEFLNRWQKPGDKSNVQRLFFQDNHVSKKAITNFVESNARLSNASYIRLKNVTLNYKLPLNRTGHGIFRTVDCFLSTDNLITVTRYKGTDPETQDIFTLPPLTTFITGIRFTF